MIFAAIIAALTTVVGFLYGFRVIEDTVDVYWGGIILGLIGLTLFAIALVLPAGWTDRFRRP